MAFNPTSTICLCNVPIDNSYKHQIYFPDESSQQEYFRSKVVKTFTDYLTVRKTLPDGSLNSRVKVNANIDSLYGCNYMFYQNANHGTKWFYAFITNYIYINEGTTEIEFETDVYQTWRHNVNVMESFVVREHSVNDEYGANLVPEKFECNDFKLEEINNVIDLGKRGYLVGCTENVLHVEYPNGKVFSGIFQGVHLFYLSSASALETFLTTANQYGSECILFIAYIPEFCVGDYTSAFKFAEGSDKPSEQDVKINFTLERLKTFYPHIYQTDEVANEKYVAKNNKLATSPYVTLVVTNNSGDELVLAPEAWENVGEYCFRMYGDVSASPSLLLVPYHFMGSGDINNYKFNISIKNFPQCSFNSDTYKLWLNKNEFGNNAQKTIGAITMALGATVAVAGTVATLGSGTAPSLAAGGAIMSGGFTMLNGASEIANAVAQEKSAESLANIGHVGVPSDNILASLYEKKFKFYLRSITAERARTIDNYFTMYGYQTNRVKHPNECARLYFTYTQTIGCNIISNGTVAVPNDDMAKLKSMYNNGVTFWQPYATVGDYSVDNREYEI